MPRASKRLRFQNAKTGNDIDAAMDETKEDASEDKSGDEDNLNDFRMHTTFIAVTIKLPKIVTSSNIYTTNTPSLSIPFHKRMRNF